MDGQKVKPGRREYYSNIFKIFFENNFTACLS